MLRGASGPECTMGLIDDSAVGSISEMHWKEERTGGQWWWGAGGGQEQRVGRKTRDET